MKKLFCSMCALFLGLIPCIHFASATEYKLLENATFEIKTKTAPIIFSARYPGKLHIINNEPFLVNFQLKDRWNHQHNSYLHPNEEVTLDLTDFRDFSKLVVYRIDSNDMTNTDLWVPKNPYIWFFSSEKFNKAGVGGKLYIRDAYVPIEED